jgi:hypothetical protein
MLHRRSTALLGLAAAIAIFVVVYGPLAGHGFVSDDFGWIQRSRLHTLTDLRPLVPAGNDFFRPAVGLSFAVDYALFGNQPAGYGLTNVLLAVACALSLGALLLRLDLPAGAAAVGGAVWLFNFHGINMAVLWLSGRTALLLTLFALATAILVVRGRYLLALIPMTLALLSKEEAVALPFLMGLWMILSPRDGRRDRRAVVLWMVLSVAVLGAYMAARHHVGAMVPATAPSYYRLTFAPSDVARNILEYADRAISFPALVTLLAWLVLRPSAASRHADSLNLRRLAYGLSWFVAGFAITIFLPVRSSLYACLPSAGACMIAAELCRLLWVRSSDSRRAVALYAAVAILLIAAAVHVTRVERWVALADLSTRVLDDLQGLTSRLPAGSQVVIHDGSNTRVNLRNAFGTMLEDAYRLKTEKSLRIWIEPALPALVAGGASAPCPTCVDLELFVGTDGHVRATP